MAKKNNNILKDNFQDLGFGSVVGQKRKRLLNRNGTFSILRTISGWRQLHLYQWLVLMKWSHFILVVVAFYLLLNVFFALLYLLVGIDQLSHQGLELADFWIAFFFSVQTLTTVGYGSVSPIGFAANVIAGTGALVGLLSFALATGLLFARFSKATINILCSDVAVIAPYREETKALMFRIVNQRKNVLSDLQAVVVASWIEVDEHNMPRRKFRSLTLEREFLVMMPLNWTLVHPLTTDSPIYNWSEAECTEKEVEFLIIIQGYDDTFANKVRSYHSYSQDEIVWNAKFKPMYYADENGNTVLEIEKLSDIEEMQRI